MRQSYSFILLLISLSFVTISLSALNTQVPLWMVHNQFLVWQMGLIGSTYFVGNLVGTIVANWIIQKLGARYSYTFTCLLFAIATIGLTLSIDFYSWAFWRFIMGIACSVTWVIVESCILVTGALHTRSKMLAIYMTTYYIGTLLGQILLQYFPKEILYFGLIIAMFMGLAVIFIMLTQYRLPKRKKGSFNLLPMILHKEARLGLVGCVVAGMLLGSLYSLLPVYFSHLGYSDNDVANWVTLLILSGVIAQFPASYIVDKYGRKIVLLMDGILLIVASILAIIGGRDLLAIILVGISCFTLYPISMAWACATVKKQDIVLMNQAMLLINTIGSLIAPAVIALAMDKLSNNYLFISFILIAIIYIFLLLLKRGSNA